MGKQGQNSFWGGSKITADGDCSHEIKICLLLGRKAMTNLDNLLHHFANKGPISQSYDFSSSHVWMWELDHKESWALRNWCFQRWRRLLRVPSIARRSNQSFLKEINPEYSLEVLMLKLKLQYFWLLDAKSQLTGKDPDTGKNWGQEEKGSTEDQTVGWHI